VTTPIRWTKQQVDDDAATATAVFREQRFAEPLEAWQTEVDLRIKDFQRLFDEYHVAKPDELKTHDITRIIDAGLLDALRYLPGPPISMDDLENLSDVRNIGPVRLRDDLDAAQRILETIQKTIDPRRFPWIVENRDPTSGERSVTIFASALLQAAQRLQTARRNDAKKEQEQAVRCHLVKHGFAPIRLARIATYADFPSRGVCSANEVIFGAKKADVLVRLWDDRMLPIECKVSNSEVNSFKRLNHETLSKHTSWTGSFGSANVVPCAILAGVFSSANVLAAQEHGLAIFWSHRIEDLGTFVESTR
jgi:hypothetical protein